MCGFIAQLVEHRTGIAEVMGSNPVEALIFFSRLLLSNCLNWKIYCDDHTSLSNLILDQSLLNRSRHSERALLGGTNSFAGQFLHQTPVQSSRSIQHMQTIQGFQIPMSSLNNFDVGPVFASQIKKLRKSFTWWNQRLCRSVLTPNFCTKFKIHSAHADNPGVSIPMSSLNNFDFGPVFASQIKKLRKSFTWWNQLLCRSVLTPNSCTKFKIHSVHADHPGVSNPISSLNNFDVGPVFAPQIKKLRKSLTWWNQLLCRSVLTPNSCTKFKIHSVHADHPGVLNPISSLNNFDIGPVFASQIKKLRKSFTWWNQLLCRSVFTPNSCTKFKIHSVHADHPGVSNPICSLNNVDIGPVFASQIKKLRKSFTSWN